MYYYFIYYATSDGGRGNCGIHYNKQIDSLEDIQNIERVINEDKNFKELVVSNFKLLSYTDPDE